MQRRVLLSIAGSLGAMMALGGCGDHGDEGADCPMGPHPKTPSGFCVPRYVSLKRGEVFGRKGPGKDYPTVFTYHARGLPVQVIDESTDWRKICDPDGGVAWVSATMIDGQRTVMALGTQPLTLRDSPKDGAAAAAYLRPRAVAELKTCHDGWCQVSAGGGQGWVKRADVWGLAAPAQCPSPPAPLSPSAAPATPKP